MQDRLGASGWMPFGIAEASVTVVDSCASCTRAPLVAGLIQRKTQRRQPTMARRRKTSPAEDTGYPACRGTRPIG